MCVPNDWDMECCLSGGEALLTSTEDTVGLWQKYSEDLLIPTDKSSVHQAESGDDLSITEG